jgi:transcriptional regulator with XRE-family HTH domain
LQPLDKERVKEWRGRRMLSQQEVADRAGTSLFTIQRIERGEGNVRPKTGRGVAAALGVPIEELLPKVQAPLFRELPESALEEERREAIYEPWLNFVNRYADRWEARIAAGDFDIGNVNEFIATLEDLGPTLHELNTAEVGKLPEQPGSFGAPGAKTGLAIWRLADLLSPLARAYHEKFEESAPAGATVTNLQDVRERLTSIQHRAAG